MAPGLEGRPHHVQKNAVRSERTLRISKICLREILQREFSRAIKVNRGGFGTASVERSADMKTAALRQMKQHRERISRTLAKGDLRRQHECPKNTNAAIKMHSCNQKATC